MEGSKRRRRNEDEVTQVTDAEVEEFYAILRRIFVASKSQRPPATWSPSFAPEDFQLTNTQTDAPAPAPAPPVRRLLDLNQDPEPDELS